MPTAPLPPPFVAPILRHRRACAALLGVGAVLVTLATLGVELWTCPLRSLTGVPCPGCGMTRATAALLRGDLPAAWALHPFSLLVLPFACLLLVSVAAPARLHTRLCDAVERLEAQTRAPLLVAVAMLVYGVARAAGQLPLT